MKKTKQTLLTALSFTAALQMASTANVNAVTEEEIGAIGVQAPFRAEEQEIQDVYGPAPDYWDNPETTTTCIQTTYGPPAMTTTLSDIQTIETRTTTVYGPPRAYYTADLNDDGSVDVFDVIQLRKTLLKNLKSESFFWDITYDVNRDGEFSVADLVAMQNYLLGRTPDMTTPVDETIVTTSDTTEPIPTTTTTFNTDVQLMYGPPNTTFWRTTDFVTETTTLDPIITAIQPMYGPPMISWITDVSFDTTTTTFNPSTMPTQPMYGSINPWFDWTETTTTTRRTTSSKTTTRRTNKTTTTTSIQTTTTTSDFEFDPRETGVQLMYGPPEYFGLNSDN